MGEDRRVDVEVQDERFGRIAMMKGFVTPAKLKACLDDVHARRTGGQPTDLETVLQERGYLSPQQTLEVREWIRRHETKSVSSAPEAMFIGKYRIVRELGRGGLAVVYEAEDTELRRRVAIKVLKDLEPDRRDDVTRRFTHEAISLGKLRHPGIVTLYEMNHAEGMDYLALEYVEGTTLEEAMERKQLDRAAFLRVIEQVARAIHYAHEQGVIHRDLKPANILLRADRSAVVTDFGLARMLESTTRLTRTGSLLGTPLYMSPEQARGGPLDHRSDIYPLGVMLYEVLTGQPPFSGKRMTELLVNISVQDPIAPRLHRADIEVDLETICLKSLEKDPNHRYASAKDLADDLQRFQRGEPILARRTTFIGRAVRKLRGHKGLTVLGSAMAAALIVTPFLVPQQAALAAAAAGVVAALGVASAAAGWRLHRARSLERAKPLMTEALSRIQQWDANLYKPPFDITSTYADLEQAVAQLKQAWSLAPELHEAYFYLGEICARMQLSAEADAQYSRAIELAHRPPALYFYGRGMARLTRLADTRHRMMTERFTEEQIRRATAEQEREVYGDMEEAARLGLPQQQERHAQVALAFTQRKVDEACALCREGLARDAGDEALWFILGASLAARGLYAEADEALQKAVEIRRSYFEAWRELTRIRNERFKIECEHKAIQGLHRPEILLKARDAASTALKIFPRSADVYALRANYFMVLDELTDSKLDCDRALEIDPGHAMALSIKGILLYIDNDPEQGIEFLRRAERAGRTDSRLYLHLGVAYSDAGRPAQAIEPLTRAIELEPGHWYLYLFRGLARVRRDPPDLDGARIDFAKVQEILPDYGLVHYGSAFVHEALGEWDAAEASFERALRMPSTQFRECEIVLARARVRARQGRIEEARRDLDRARALREEDKPEDVRDRRYRERESHLVLGEIYLHQGDAQAALREAEAALASHPQERDPQALKARAERSLSKAPAR